MASAHQHHSRYALQPPPQNSQSDFRLPSLKDLNFAYKPPTGQAAELPQAQQEHPPPPTNRHPAAWGRSAQTSAQSAAPAPHQQHTPPLSAGHDIPTKVEYPSRHENGGYAHPGIPLSAQAAPVPGSVNIGAQREDGPHSPNQPKRHRTASNNMSASRDIRASHPGYPPPQYASYTPAPQPQATSAYHQIPSGLPGPPTHAAQTAPPPPPQEQMHHHPMPISAHPGYPPYQQAYLQPRQPLMQQQHPPPHQSQPNHSNPYPSPGPPPAAPPPQGPWAQAQPQPQHPPPQPPPPHHHQQAPPQPPPPQQHPSHMQPHLQQQPQAPLPPNPPHAIQQQHHQQHPPPAPPPTQQHLPPPPQQQHQPPPQYAQQYQSPQPPPLQQQQQQQQAPPQMSYARTTAIVPTTIETRPVYQVAEPERVPSVRNDTMTEITNHCNALYSFASRYAQLQHSLPHAQPSPGELEEMSQRALTVVRLLDDLRRMNMPEGVEQQQQQQQPAPVQMQESPDDPRPPKRPWEDISQDDGAIQIVEQNGFQQDQYSTAASGDTKQQTTAEQDMELIRTKRAATTTAQGASGSAGGQPKSKYRKRSSEQRASPPGKCHSCNIRETPEWRRGPDGARTLCNACGLHYAKLMRKRDKANQNGEAPHIDLETLRASARAADIAEKATRSAKQQASSSRTTTNGNHHHSDSDSPMDGSASASTSTIKPVSTQQQQPPPPPPQQQTHQSSFQLVTMMAPPPPTSAGDSQSQPSSSSNMQVDRPQSQQHQQQHQQRQPQQQQPQHQQQQPVAAQHHALGGHPPPITAHPPPPPWPTTASSRDVYNSQGHIHQSFMRGSQQQQASR